MTPPTRLARSLPAPRATLVLALSAALAATMLVGCASTRRTGASDASVGYAFWPPFPAEPRMQFLVSYRYSSDIEAPRSRFQQLVFGRDSGVLPINKPYGVEIWDGRIYVCDIRNATVVVLDVKHRRTKILVSRRLGGIRQPVDIAIASDGTKYVSDLQRGLVFVFDADDRATTAFGWPGLKPTGVAVLGDELYLCDFASQSVVVMDRFSGDKVRQIGGPGSEDGQFVRPLGIAVNPQGNIVVSDVIRCRIQTFSPTGQLLGAFGEIGDSAGSFVRPKHVAADKEGIIYVVDAAYQNVQMFDDQGQVLMFFGSAGSHPGNMNLPAGVCVTDQNLGPFRQYIHPSFDARKLVIVTNQFGANKVSVYALGQLKPGITVQDLAGTAALVAPGVQADDTPGGPTPTLTPETPDSKNPDVAPQEKEPR